MGTINSIAADKIAPCTKNNKASNIIYGGSQAFLWYAASEAEKKFSPPSLQF